jgi:hypothetical protein
MEQFRLVCIFLVITSASLLAQSNPVPLIYQPLSPTGVEPGHAAFTLTVHGTSFVKGTSVQWNGTPLLTQFVSTQLLKAQVPAKLVAASSTASITVKNPNVIASNVIYFSARLPSFTVTVEANTKIVEAGQIAVGDFNNDSNPDIAVQAVDTFFDIYLNKGHGSFAKIPGPQWGGSGVLPAPINITADFNGDGNLDASMCFSTGSPSTGCVIYLGDGHGDLTQVSGFNLVQGSGAAADTNGDGVLDYVSVVASSDGIGSSLLVNVGNGDGTFQRPSTTPLNGNTIGGTPVVGDFNRDGRLDVAIPVGSNVAVFLAKADGTFRKEVDYPVTNPGWLAVADVNGDGTLDIVTSGVSVLLGKGDGTFTAGNSVLLPGQGGNLEIADINGDGILDLITATVDSNFNQTVNILLGDGKGSFQTPITFAEGEEYLFPALHVADFNNDGKLDIVVSGQSSTALLIQNSSSR